MIMRIVMMMMKVPFLIPLENWGVDNEQSCPIMFKIENSEITISNNPVNKLPIMVIQQISTNTNFQHGGIMPDSNTNFPQN